MASVTFSSAVGGDNSTVSDDSNPTTGLANGGHRTRFVPALGQLVAVASYVVSQASAAGASASAASGSASTASAAAGTATTQAAAAAASAVAAANSAAATQSSNVNGTSVDSIAIATANGQSKALTYAEAGRAIVNGMFLVFAAAASPSVNWMLIQVTGWNSGTRVVTGDVVAYQGSGTYASWIISGPSGPQGPAGQDADLLMPWTARSGAFMLVQGDKGGASKLTSATVTFDTPAALGNGWTHVLEGTSGTSTLTASFADGSSSKKLAQGRHAYLACDGTAIRYVMFGQPGLTGGVTLVATSQTVALPVGLCKITAVGGGGGVSSVYPGGSGATCIKYIVGTGQNAVITIGAAGSGSSNGGDTTVVIDGVTYTAGGGKAGGQGGGHASPGDGGVATNGDINITGQPGTGAAPSDGVAGSGGSSTLGGGRRGGTSTNGGVTAAGYGGGGSQIAGNPQIGGNGVVLIEY